MLEMGGVKELSCKGDKWGDNWHLEVDRYGKWEEKGYQGDWLQSLEKEEALFLLEMIHNQTEVFLYIPKQMPPPHVYPGLISNLMSAPPLPSAAQCLTTAVLYCSCYPYRATGERPQHPTVPNSSPEAPPNKLPMVMIVEMKRHCLSLSFDTTLEASGLYQYPVLYQYSPPMGDSKRWKKGPAPYEQESQQHEEKEMMGSLGGLRVAMYVRLLAPSTCLHACQLIACCLLS